MVSTLSSLAWLVLSGKLFVGNGVRTQSAKFKRRRTCRARADLSQEKCGEPLPELAKMLCSSESSVMVQFCCVIEVMAD